MLKAWLSHCTQKERAPDPAQGKVLTELHGEKVKCVCTHTHTHPTSQPTQSPRHTPCKDTLCTQDTHTHMPDSHTDIYSHHLTYHP